MKTTTNTFVISLALGVLAASPAQASEQDDWYASVSGTISLLDDVDSETVGLPAPILSVETISVMNTGYGIQAAVGREIGMARIEIEAGYTHNSSDAYIAIKPPTGEIPADGRQTSLRVMANAYLDFGRGDLRPYVGAGVGYADFGSRLFAPRAPFPTEDPILIIDDHQSDWAYQVMAGVAYEISPGLHLTAGYRWLDAGNVHFRDRGDFEVIRSHQGHNIDVGIRFAL